MARHTAKSHKIRKVEILVIQILIELRESTGMNRHQFCEYFEIPYMTVSDWEHGKKRVPKYFLRLLEYYVKAEQMNKAKEEQNNG